MQARAASLATLKAAGITHVVCCVDREPVWPVLALSSEVKPNAQPVPNQCPTSAQPVPNQCPTSAQPMPNQYPTSAQPVPNQCPCAPLKSSLNNIPATTKQKKQARRVENVHTAAARAHFLHARVVHTYYLPRQLLVYVLFRRGNRSPTQPHALYGHYGRHWHSSGTLWLAAMANTAKQWYALIGCNSQQCRPVAPRHDLSYCYLLWPTCCACYYLFLSLAVRRAGQTTCGTAAYPSVTTPRKPVASNCFAAHASCPAACTLPFFWHQASRRLETLLYLQCSPVPGSVYCRPVSSLRVCSRLGFTTAPVCVSSQRYVLCFVLYKPLYVRLTPVPGLAALGTVTQAGKLGAYFARSFAFIGNALSSGGAVLVHCNCGQFVVSLRQFPSIPHTAQHNMAHKHSDY